MPQTIYNPIFDSGEKFLARETTDLLTRHLAKKVTKEKGGEEWWERKGARTAWNGMHSLLFQSIVIALAYLIIMQFSVIQVE